MSLKQQKQIIVDAIHALADDIESGSNMITIKYGKLKIDEMYEIMRLISDWSEDIGIRE